MTERNLAKCNEILGKYYTNIQNDDYQKAFNAISEIVETMEDEIDELKNTILNDNYTIRALLTGNSMLAQKVATQYNDDNLNF